MDQDSFIPQHIPLRFVVLNHDKVEIILEGQAKEAELVKGIQEILISFPRIMHFWIGDSSRQDSEFVDVWSENQDARIKLGVNNHIPPGIGGCGKIAGHFEKIRDGTFADDVGINEHDFFVLGPSPKMEFVKVMTMPWANFGDIDAIKLQIFRDLNFPADLLKVGDILGGDGIITFSSNKEDHVDI